MVDPEAEGTAPERAASQDEVNEPAEGDAILGATIDALKRAAHGVEIERQVAETLQRSLLPEIPPIPGLRVAARYRPGSAETRIGGDWYDTIPLRGGKVGIAIGDVVGRGVEAAARMAHLQSALRAYALEALRPELVLERMNSFVLEGEQGGMVTLLYAIVDPDASTLQVATAGHPPPLILRPEGKPVFAEAPAGEPARSQPVPFLRGEPRDSRPLVDRAPVHGWAGRGSGAAVGRGARGPSRHRRELSARARGTVPLPALDG